MIEIKLNYFQVLKIIRNSYSFTSEWLSKSFQSSNGSAEPPHLIANFFLKKIKAKFGQNQNLASSKTLDLRWLCDSVS